jgi:hypothetical protein
MEECGLQHGRTYVVGDWVSKDVAIPHRTTTYIHTYLHTYIHTHTLVSLYYLNCYILLHKESNNVKVS